jgi:hypothetical protein
MEKFTLNDIVTSKGIVKSYLKNYNSSFDYSKNRLMYLRSVSPSRVFTTLIVYEIIPRKKQKELLPEHFAVYTIINSKSECWNLKPIKINMNGFL